MTIVVESNSTAAWNGTTIEPTEPSGAAENDLIIACYGHYDTTVGDSAIYTVPADFTELFDEWANLGSVDMNHGIAWKIREADAGSGYQFTRPTATPASGSIALIRISGVNTSTPFDVTYSQGLHEDIQQNGQQTSAPITTVTNGALVCLFQRGMSPLSAPSTQGAPSGYTLDVGVYPTTNAFLCFASKTVATAGTETPGAWTHSTVDATDDYVSTTIALRPDQSPVPILSTHYMES